MSEKTNFKDMLTEELRIYVRHNESEEAFDEYSPRLDWKTPPKFSSIEEEEKFVEDLIASKTKK